ncbi:hypothetical protein BKE30_09810 [Alkanindiges hydrocarboniclasticus]|uniref:Uncharacterized protein n=1 Tax=Alkanindiges hydrocarboniclasticus TaxID=1907941 RepID=A0A1S8CTR8_9GAMM|nr:hypothetical protein [Alkanindiges hydrocarboniclasticus]ONG39314.1 hypothetical protein BKE30_09810 [Alkanindiges hydrocarboniclasticus]
MSNIKYVIRHNEFAYNDEWFLTDDATAGRITAVYTDKAEAEQAYKTLIVDALYNEYELSQYDIGNGEADDETYEKIEAFVLEKTGKPFDSETLPEMSEDDAFEFARLSGILCYQLIEFDDSKPHYALWINAEESYMDHYDTGSILFDHDPDFIEDSDCDWYFLSRIEQTLQGSLADLSDSPEILQAFLQNAAGISFDAQQQALVINGNGSNYQTIKALNALLKQPLFEIHSLTLEQIQAL